MTTPLTTTTGQVYQKALSPARELGQTPTGDDDAAPHARPAVGAIRADDHLDAEEVTSGAFVDNPASNAVSAKVGYQLNGVERRHRRPGELALAQRFRLARPELDRSGVELQVSGVEAFRRFIGLDQPA